MTVRSSKGQKNAKKGKPLDAERRAQFLELIRQGYSKHLAAPAAGVARTTINEWLKSGRSEHPKHPEHKRFADAYAAAEAEGTRTLYANLMRLSETDTKAALAILRARGVPGFGPSATQQARQEAANTRLKELAVELAQLKNQAARAALDAGGAESLILGLETLVDSAALSLAARDEIRQALAVGSLASVSARDLG